MIYGDDLRRNKLGNIIKSIHHKIPRKQIDTLSVGDHEVRKGYLNGKEIKRLIIYMRSSGCQWMLEDNGGCAMCGHLAGTTLGVPIKAEDYIQQFENIISQSTFADIPMLCVYNAGAFFNDKEMPIEARMHIYDSISKIKEIKHVIFESRAEFIHDHEMQCLRKSLPDKRLEIGVGLESSNEFIRHVCLNKGLDISKFLDALKVMKRNNIHSLAYILLKPPFLDEKPAIEDATASIDWAFRNGVDVVSLEPASVQYYTLIHLLYNMKLFRPPWIWSVLEVIKNTGNKGLIRIGGFEFFPPPSVCTHNCPSCNDFFVNAVEEYNTSNDLSIISNALKMECRTCKKIWEDSLQSMSDVKDNIDNFLNTFDSSLIEKYLIPV
jgi:radical SAM enzyme (TIGR01210 family)